MLSFAKVFRDRDMWSIPVYVTQLHISTYTPTPRLQTAHKYFDYRNIYLQN